MRGRSLILAGVAVAFASGMFADSGVGVGMPLDPSYWGAGIANSGTAQYCLGWVPGLTFC